MKICVVGAGAMGSGIAQVFAAAGYGVFLCDVTAELAEKGKARISASLEKAVSKNKMSADEARAAEGRITAGTTELAGGADWVVEAVLEDMNVKKVLFCELDGICGEDTVFSTNTSSLSITELDADCRHSVIGMHFFNPAPIMQLVEVIPGMNTPDALVERACELVSAIGKTPVRCRESAGFVVNRILIPMINEAVGVYADGVASAEDIDTAMKLGANHPIGPLALGDLIGLDVVLAIMQTIYSETGDDKYRPHPLLKQMVRAGTLGRKSGRGFFGY